MGNLKIDYINGTEVTGEFPDPEKLHAKEASLRVKGHHVCSLLAYGSPANDSNSHSKSECRCV